MFLAVTSHWLTVCDPRVFAKQMSPNEGGERSREVEGRSLQGPVRRLISRVFAPCVPGEAELNHPGSPTFGT